MANRIYITTENIKSLINQYKDNKDKIILSHYKPPQSDDTLVLSWAEF